MHSLTPPLTISRLSLSNPQRFHVWQLPPKRCNADDKHAQAKRMQALMRLGRCEPSLGPLTARAFHYIAIESMNESVSRMDDGKGKNLGELFGSHRYQT